MKLKRRDFLKSTGLAGAGLFVFNPVVKAFVQNVGKGKAFRTEGWYPSTCQGCTTWCPIELFVQNGRVIKARGNQHSLTSSAYCCPRGHLIPHMIYDPDRVKVPMKRTNPVKGKGVDPQFVPITWDAAMDLIADKILDLRTNNETHKFLLMRGRYTGANGLLYSALPKIIGSPNNISHSAICAEAEKMGSMYTEGFFGYRDYDLAETKFLVLWGVDPFRSNRQVPRAINAMQQLSENASLVTIDPYHTIAASKSDEWFAIKPGEDGALAVAIAHHILVSGIWNKTFIGDFNGSGVSSFVANTPVNEADFTEVESQGLVKWWNIELKDKTPAWASAITGIAENRIKTLAEDMAAQAPYVSIWYGPGPVMSPRGTYTAMTIHALNGLMGSVDHPGGPITSVSAPSASLPSTANYVDAIASAGNAYPKIDQRGTLKFPALNTGTSGGGVVTNNVANAMLDEDPYEIKMAIGYWCNFNFSCTEPDRWHNAMANLPFFVHITTHAAEMSQYADIVLPASFHAGERWSFVKTSGNLHGEVSIQQPLINKVFDTKTDETEITFLLAQKLSGKGFHNLLNYYRNEFPDPDTGILANTPEDFALYSTKFFTKPSWDLLPGEWNELLDKGVHTKGPYVFQNKWGGNFPTVSGYFEFFSLKLQQALQAHASKHSTSVDQVLSVCNYEASGDQAFVPHYESPLRYGDRSEYPFDLVDVKSRLAREGRSGNHPYVSMFRSLDLDDLKWDDCIKINPDDAKQLDIADGSMVKVSTVIGSFITKARLYEGVQPGTLTKTFGQGHWAYGRFASHYASFQEKGLNNNELMKDEYDRLSGSTCRNGGFMGVRIERL